MFERNSLKRALIGSTALISGAILAPLSALAASCPANIAGTAFSDEVCEFDTGNSITISSGGEVGGINQESYDPIGSFIINNGIISSHEDMIAIAISSSSLSNGLINNGIIDVDGGGGILVTDESIISGGITNAGSITSENYITLELSGGSTANGNITNSGSIISNSINNPAILIRDEITVNGNIDNSGIIRAYGEGSGVHIDFTAAINGDIINSGTIRGGGSGLLFSITTNVAGDITNSGTITGDANDGIVVLNESTIEGDVINEGTISGGTNGIRVDEASAVDNLINQVGATILGGEVGISIANGSTLNGGIQNYGTITGSVNAIYINVDSNVGVIDTYDGSVIEGSIDAVGTDVNVNGGQINGTMNVNSVMINAGSLFTMDYAITAQDVVTNAGTLAIGTTTQTINSTNGYVQSAGGELEIEIENTVTYGQLVVDNTVDLSQSGTINVEIVNGFNIAKGDIFENIVSGNELVAPTDGFNVTDNILLLNFDAVVNDASGVDLIVIDDVNTSIFQSNAATGNSVGAGAARKLDDMIDANPAGDWQNILNVLYTLTNDQEITAVVNQILPTLTGATNTAIIKTITTASRMVQARQESNSGLSSGEDFQADPGFWFKPFASRGDQGTKDGVVGYDSEAHGFITGIDKMMTDRTRLGVGVSYSNSELNRYGDNHQVNVDSYLGIIYGSYHFDDRTDVNAQLAVGYNNSDSRRNINFGGLNRIAKGSYDGWNFQANTGVSRLVKLGSNTTITPQARLDYVVVGNEKYDESGAGVLSLHVGSQTQDELIPALEVKAKHHLTSQLSLALNGGLGYNLLNDHNTVSASFVGSGVFITRGLESSPWVIYSGAGLTWQQSDVLDLTASYDREDRGSEYENQTVSLKFRIPF